MIKTTCRCIWCDATYSTTQPQRRKFCGESNCYKQFHKAREKFGCKENKDFFDLINNWVAQGSHPNPNHTISAADRVLADLYRAATELVKVETLLFEVAAKAGAQPDKSLVDIINEVKLNKQ